MFLLLKTVYLTPRQYSLFNFFYSALEQIVLFSGLLPCKTIGVKLSLCPTFHSILVLNSSLLGSRGDIFKTENCLHLTFRIAIENKRLNNKFKCFQWLRKHGCFLVIINKLYSVRYLEKRVRWGCVFEPCVPSPLESSLVLKV